MGATEDDAEDEYADEDIPAEYLQKAAWWKRNDRRRRHTTFVQAEVYDKPVHDIAS